ncbi:hypothetical protein ACFLQ4_01950 [Bacteroidota bacterium]
MRTTKDFQIAFRVKKNDRDKIFNVADEADYSVSEFVRTIVLKHLKKVKTKISQHSEETRSS